MFDLDGRVRQWRERQERTSSLSPRELDELEDHLRARVDLEMELNAVLGPQQAFAIARHDLGEAAVLEKEFAKVGKPRWKRWLVAGWAAYVAAWFLPVLRINVFGLWVDTIYGHQLFLDPELLVFVPLHLAMLMTVSALWGGRISRARWLRCASSDVRVAWCSGGSPQSQGTPFSTSAGACCPNSSTCRLPWPGVAPWCARRSGCDCARGSGRRRRRRECPHSAPEVDDVRS